MDGGSQMIESCQCATLQELPLRTHACFLLQYYELRTVTTVPSFIVCMLKRAPTHYILPKPRENCVIVQDLK